MRIVLSLPEAKRRLTGDRKCTHHDLYKHLTHQFPTLKRLVSGIHGGRVKTSETWKTILLLAVALSVAVSTSTL